MSSSGARVETHMNVKEYSNMNGLASTTSTLAN